MRIVGADRMLRQQSRQANRFVAKFFANQIFPTRRFVAFVKQEVERLQNAIQSLC